MAKNGRPTDYTQEKADLICAKLAEGKSLRTVCKEEKFGMTAVFNWLRTNASFAKQYAQAKEEATDALAEEIHDIADQAHSVIIGDRSDNARVHAQQMRVDTRKWIMSKMKPKKYGDKLDMTTNGKDIPAPIYGGKSVGK